MKANGAKVAIVTGAGHGIGRACAVELPRQGWACVCADVDAARAEETAASAGGRAVACDVSKEEDVKRLIGETASAFGRIDAIVSNAGIMHRKPLSETTLEDWNTVIATNLTAAFLLAKFGDTQLPLNKGARALIASTRAHMSATWMRARSLSPSGCLRRSVTELGGWLLFREVVLWARFFWSVPGPGNRALEGAVRYYDQPPFPAHAYIAGRPVERKQELSQSRLLSEFA